MSVVTQPMNLAQRSALKMAEKAMPESWNARRSGVHDAVYTRCGGQGQLSEARQTSREFTGSFQCPLEARETVSAFANLWVMLLPA